MSERVVVLTGGVGGAKLVNGLYRLLPAGSMTAIVNTGDDFCHYGLPISPDIDTLLYTLAGKSNRELGWGREGETWNFMAALKSLGGEDWFNLGDGDLALHVLRGAALAAGELLSAIIARFASAWGLTLAVLPMSDDPFATWVESDEGPLPFQRYFVERRCAPRVSRVWFEGAEQAAPAPGVVEAIGQADAVLIAPSNPWLSIDPLLAVPGIKSALSECSAPVVAVSPLVGGNSVKGPTAKLMAELGLAVTNASIAGHYAGLIDGLVTHDGDDAPEGIAVARTDTMMHEGADRERVATAALALAERLRSWNHWRAVVPFKLGADAKSRLAGLLSPAERGALSLRMANHVLRILEDTGRFAEITLLSPDRPDWWGGAWAADTGAGLNAELMTWRAAQGAAPVLVIHTDLPLLVAAEVAQLLDAAEASGVALATDHAGEGSNALAIADGREFAFRFGRGSRALHAAQVPGMPVIVSPGLAADLDTPEDADFLVARGFTL